MIAFTPLRGLSHAPRRVLILASAAFLCLFLLPAVAARADTSSTLTVVGTSDVSDSGLVQNLIEPEFLAADPNITSFKYNGSATGAAINAAENGTGGPSVLIVHAASLENQFVASGYSYNNQYGYAVFRNDFVLAGPAAPDPAGVSANAPNNIVQAFADIATAGNAGTAQFVSRGNTSGTTVEEHQIWARLQNPATNGGTAVPSSLYLCALNSANGGGETPVIAADGSNTYPAPQCPTVTVGSVTTQPIPSGPELPAWYVDTAGVSQGQNVLDANTCPSNPPYPANSCYVFTDRGTFDYLASGTSPIAQTGGIPNLHILTRNDSPSAPGGQYELVNYFHAYIINPNKDEAGTSTPEPVNLAGAEAFISFLTSPTFQGQLRSYLDDTSDIGGAPFIADASPTITASGIPGLVVGGTDVTVSGAVTNSEPGYPPVASAPVTVDELLGGLPVPVASGTTNASGGYSITFEPTSSGSYEVTTGTISQIENAALSPPFGDQLSPAASPAITASVQAGISISSTTPSPGLVTVSGKLAPGAPDPNATVTLLYRSQGSKGGFTQFGGTSLPTGATSYVVAGSLPAGKRQVEAEYRDPGLLVGATSSAVNVSVTSLKGAHTVSFKKVKIKKGKVTATGTLKPAPTASGAKVELLAMKSGSVRFKVVAKTSVRKGKTTFTIKAKLGRGSRWYLQLEYVQKGETTTYSKLTSVQAR